MLRPTKLSVLDEVENALSYFEATFFSEVPKLYAAVERALEGETKQLHAFLEIGTWIGGDRDGNPFVDAVVLKETLSLQAERALNYYISEARKLRRELSACRTLRACHARGAATCRIFTGPFRASSGRTVPPGDCNRPGTAWRDPCRPAWS